jgi:N utilization substance protein A
VPIGRIGAMAAKQVILQKIRDAEREMLLNDFMSRGDKIFVGTVKRMDKGDLIVESGRVEGRLKRNEMIPKENLRVGDRVRAYLLKIDRQARGPQLILSRVAPDFIVKLFELEVPEIADGLVEIRNVAREAGWRSKIAVVSNVQGVDPVGACVGPRGSRVRMVVSELRGEKIDIIPFNDEPARYVAKALSPARVREVLVDDEARQAVVIVPDDQLSLAIGKEGMNARLAARLTGWRIDIKSESTFAAEEERDDYGDELEGGVARCSHILQNGRRCPNAVVPGTRHCALPGHDQPQASAPVPADDAAGDEPVADEPVAVDEPDDASEAEVVEVAAEVEAEVVTADGEAADE